MLSLFTPFLNPYFHYFCKFIFKSFKFILVRLFHFFFAVHFFFYCLLLENIKELIPKGLLVNILRCWVIFSLVLNLALRNNEVGFIVYILFLIGMTSWRVNKCFLWDFSVWILGKYYTKIFIRNIWPRLRWVEALIVSLFQGILKHRS